MINYSQLSNSEPNISYSTSKLKSNGFKLEFVLNQNNPIYSEVINKCKECNFLYEIQDGDDEQRHIWIKGWKKLKEE